MSVDGIEGVTFVPLDARHDERGSFVEVFRASKYNDLFVQSNHSSSRAGVLRGLHYHLRQADLWYVVKGRAHVGLVDLRVRQERPKSATVTLDAADPACLYIPPGVAHGFFAETDLELLYWVTSYYDASDEHGVVWNDPAFDLRWPTESPILSARDAANPPLKWEQIPSFS